MSSPSDTETPESVVELYGGNAEFDALVRKALEHGIKMDAPSVLRIWHLPEIRTFFPDVKHGICWIDQGNATAGYELMLKHIKEFEDVGIDKEQLKELAEAATIVGKDHGRQSKKRSGRVILSLWFLGRPIAVVISVGSNGYVVGMNRGSLKECRKRAGLTEEELDTLLRQNHFWS